MSELPEKFALKYIFNILVCSSLGNSRSRSTEVGNFTLCLRSVLQPGGHLHEMGPQEMTWEKSTVFKL